MNEIDTTEVTEVSREELNGGTHLVYKKYDTLENMMKDLNGNIKKAKIVNPVIAWRIKPYKGSSGWRCRVSVKEGAI